MSIKTKSLSYLILKPLKMFTPPPSPSTAVGADFSGKVATLGPGTESKGLEVSETSDSEKES